MGLKKLLFGDPAKHEEARKASSVSATPAKTPLASKPASAGSSAGGASSGGGKYKRVKVERGMKGWGGPLEIAPEPGKDLIYSVTGGGIHPVAQKIADLTGGTPFDGFRSKADFHEIAVAVIDCGGTARVGVYPMKNVLTVDIHATSPSGPLMRFIKEENFVSGVKEDNITLLD